MLKHIHIMRVAAIVVFACVLGQPELALSQALPWKTSPDGQGTAQTQTQPAHTQHSKHSNANTSPASGSNSRDADDRKLNSLASRFYGIHEKDKDALAKIKALESEVKSFTSTLKNKSYDADILKDAQNLERRIARQRTQWEKAAGYQASAAHS